MWKDLPVPLTASFYLFHISNANDVYNKGAKPMLVEKGPYVFQEFHHKIDEVWNENGTVTYKQIKRWIHVSGDIEENVTIVNSVYATVGAQVHMPFCLLSSTKSYFCQLWQGYIRCIKSCQGHKPVRNLFVISEESSSYPSI